MNIPHQQCRAKCEVSRQGKMKSVKENKPVLPVLGGTGCLTVPERSDGPCLAEPWPCYGLGQCVAGDKKITVNAGSLFFSSEVTLT